LVDIVLAKFETKESQIERYSYFPPYGILYLADSLERAGFKVKLFHKEGTKSNVYAFAEFVCQTKPLFVGFSTLTGPTILPTVEASKAIKERCRIPLVWGSHHPTILPEQTLRNEFVDIVVLGEGESTVVELAEVLREYGMETRKLSDIAGIGFKKNGRPFFTPPRPFIENLDDLYPGWHHLDINEYFFTENIFRKRFQQEMKVATVITSRGCPWRCSYCYNQKVNKRTFRAQSVERTLRDILELKSRFGVNAIVFEDDNFFTNKKRALEIIHRIGMAWSATIRVDDIAKGGDAFIKDLKRNGCRELRIGAESGSPRILERLQKDITVDQIKEAARLCEYHEITAAFMFMVGFPEESWRDVCLTLDLVDELSLMKKYVMVTQLGSYTPYPGTPLYEKAIESGFKPPSSTEKWGDFVQSGYREYLPPYVDRKARSLTYYHQLLTRKDLVELSFSLPARLLQSLARWRWKNRIFVCPIDHYIPARGLRLLEKTGLSVISKKLYKK
jgi:anaerobic magnesium-protoporphyrin IX monomethyl ester cyclase